MTYGGSNQPRPSRNERREAAREKARLLREEQKKRERRNKILIQGGIIVAVVAIAALIGTLIFQSVKPAGPGPAEHGERRHRAHRRRGRRHRGRRDPGARRGRDAHADRARRQRRGREHRDVHRLPLPVLRPVRGDELRVDAHDGRVGRRHPRGAPDRDPHQQVGGHAVLAARGQRGRLRGGLLARLVLRLQRDPLREPARGGLDGPHERRARSRSPRRSASAASRRSRSASTTCSSSRGCRMPRTAR